MNAKQLATPVSTQMNHSYAEAANDTTLVITTRVNLDGRERFGTAMFPHDMTKRINLSGNYPQDLLKLQSFHRADVAEAGDYLAKNTDQVVLRVSEPKRTIMSNVVTFTTTIMISNAG